MMKLQSGPVQFTREGTGTLFYLMTLKYGLAGIFHDAADRGFSIERHYSQKDFKAGDLVKVTLRLRNTKERRFVAVTDPIPAGTEPGDSAFATTATQHAEKQRTDNPDNYDWTSLSQPNGRDKEERHHNHDN